MTSCACKCNCWAGREANCDNLCEDCWRAWCTADPGHAPVADSSYMGTYGLGNIWVGWVASQAPEILAERADALQRYENPPRCPECGESMVRRPGCWKCYRSAHEEPVVALEQARLPRSPNLRVI